MCLFCGLVGYLIVGSVYPPLNTDHSHVMNEVWNLGPQAPRQRRLEGNQGRYAGCVRRACMSTPQPLRHRVPCVPCRRWLSTLLKANPVENDGAGPLLGSWRRSLTQ